MSSDDEYDDLYDSYSDELLDLLELGPYLLTNAPKTFPTNGKEVLRSNAEVFKNVKLVEQAGVEHLRRQVASLGLNAKFSGGPAGQRQRGAMGGDGGDDEPPTSKEMAEMAAWATDGAFYKLLGLSKENLNATEDLIKKCHRKLVVRFHPDKVQKESKGTPAEMAKSKAQADAVYLAINKAFETLTDEKKRRAYDSMYEFDDSIPENSNKGEFFALFGPVFDRNARFSEIKPVPKLGKMDDDEETVTNFYNFWFGFESWRDFSAEGEKDTSNAEQRDERRYLEKQNRAAVAKMKKAEIARVADLVSRAYARDPRIARFKAKEAEEKAKAKSSKYDAVREAEAAKRRAEDEAKAAKEKEEADAKKVIADAKAAKEAKDKAWRRSRFLLKNAAISKEGIAAGIKEEMIERFLNRVKNRSEDELILVAKQVCGEDALNPPPTPVAAAPAPVPAPAPAPAPAKGGKAASGSGGKGGKSGPAPKTVAPPIVPTPAPAPVLILPPANVPLLLTILTKELAEEDAEKAAAGGASASS
jgi:DnaJ homolog subfamily C member 2